VEFRSYRIVDGIVTEEDVTIAPQHEPQHAPQQDRLHTEEASTP